MPKIKNKRLKIMNVVANILIIISLILALVLKNKFSYSLFWIIIPLIILVQLFIINKWSVRGKTVDNTIQRTFDDNTVLITVFYGIIYLIIEFIDMLNENIRNNIYFIVSFFVITIVYELLVYLSINNAKKETAKILEEKYNKKK